MFWPKPPAYPARLKPSPPASLFASSIAGSAAKASPVLTWTLSGKLLTRCRTRYSLSCLASRSSPSRSIFKPPAPAARRFSPLPPCASPSYCCFSPSCANSNSATTAPLPSSPGAACAAVSPSRSPCLCLKILAAPGWSAPPISSLFSPSSSRAVPWIVWCAGATCVGAERWRAKRNPLKPTTLKPHKLPCSLIHDPISDLHPPPATYIIYRHEFSSQAPQWPAAPCPLPRCRTRLLRADEVHLPDRPRLPSRFHRLQPGPRLPQWPSLREHRSQRPLLPTRRRPGNRPHPEIPGNSLALLRRRPHQLGQYSGSAHLAGAHRAGL